MKRRRVVSDHCEKKLKTSPSSPASSLLYNTPTRPAPQKSRFITPFRTPLKGGTPSSGDGSRKWEGNSSTPSKLCNVPDSTPSKLCNVPDSSPRKLCNVPDSSPSKVCNISDATPQKLCIISDSVPIKLNTPIIDSTASKLVESLPTPENLLSSPESTSTTVNLRGNPTSFQTPTCTRTPISRLNTFNTPVRTARDVLPGATSPGVMSPMQRFLQEKKLQREIEEKESLLRKFKQLARAQETGEIDKMKDQIRKWRTASQDVLYQLLKHGQQTQPDLALGSVIQQLKVDRGLVQYEEEEEDFREEED